MEIKTLHLQSFKNYENSILPFHSRVTCLVGLNGAGKTNVLEAIHYLAFTKGTASVTDLESIRSKDPYFRVKGLFEENRKEREVICFLERGQKKIIKMDGLAYEKLSDHIGQVQVVMCTPYDSQIIQDSSEVRRKWADGCISQHDAPYLEALLKYQRVLKQRNAHLKNCNGRLSPPAALLLDTYDQELIRLSSELSNKRVEFVQSFQPYFQENLAALVPGHERCSIHLKSQVTEAGFAEKFSESRAKDLLMQRTLLGAHRDDFMFALQGQPIRKFGSQGQQKSFLVALRLAQYDYLKQTTSIAPVLLLDDVFDKLDDGRIHNLVSILQDNSRFGQVILTDARKERTLSFFDKEHIQLVEIENGTIRVHE
ncbi:MAG: DNA replication and repair protein RecF [Cyclobacteriaceae bacterium]|nr:DNA replication and repair protein RecF [Cyclobacteriaceae bacterium]